MTVQCASCANFTLQNADGHNGRQMAEAGFGTCSKKPTAGLYESARFERHCHQFVETDKATIIKRVNWLTARRQEFENKIRAAQAKESQ